MKRKLISSFVLSATFLMVCAPLSAHHGSPTFYQMDKMMTVTGTVTKFVFTNPHPQLYFDAKDENGRVQHWGAELGPTPTVLKSFGVGWGKESLRPGDQITITMRPYKTPGVTVGFAMDIVANGRKLALSAEQAQQPVQ